MDIRGLNDAALIEKTGLEFHIHPLALEDVLNTQQRSKYEDFENGFFFVIVNLKINSDTLQLEPEQIALFCGKNYLVSFQEDVDDSFQAVFGRLHDNRGRIRKKGPDYLAYALVDTIVDNYYVVLDELEASMETLEINLHNGSDLPLVKDQIYQMKRSVNNFKRYLIPLRDAVTKFHRADHEFIDDSITIYLRDVADHVVQILDQTDNFRENLNSYQELYQSEVANRLNHVMRVLTVISTIFMPLSFLASLYGMNFENMPELHTRYGYYFLLFAMLAIFIGLLAFFRKKRWV